MSASAGKRGGSERSGGRYGRSRRSSRSGRASKTRSRKRGALAWAMAPNAIEKRSSRYAVDRGAGDGVRAALARDAVAAFGLRAVERGIDSLHPVRGRFAAAQLAHADGHRDLRLAQERRALDRAAQDLRDERRFRTARVGEK